MIYGKHALLGVALLGGLLVGGPVMGNSANAAISPASHTSHPTIAYRSTSTSSADLARNPGANSVAPEAPISNNLSANWAGYVADKTNTNYTAVGASWVVPTVASDSSSGSAPASADATWVGIGGVSSSDLIQAGTQAIAQNGQVSYQAWVETLPDVLEPIPLGVSAGDSVTVSLAERKPGQWGLSFHNNTTGQNYQTTLTYNSSHTSAEWIEEMPIGGTGNMLGYLPLDNFGSVTFENAYTTADGTTENIASAGAQKLSMAANGQTILADASALNSGSGFTVLRTAAPAETTSSGDYSLGGHRHRFGYSVSSSDDSTSTEIGLLPDQWTTIPFSLGDNGWVQILFR